MWYIWSMDMFRYLRFNNEHVVKQKNNRSTILIIKCMIVPILDIFMGISSVLIIHEFYSKFKETIIVFPLF